MNLHSPEVFLLEDNGGNTVFSLAVGEKLPVAQLVQIISKVKDKMDDIDLLKGPMESKWLRELISRSTSSKKVWQEFINDDGMELLRFVGNAYSVDFVNQEFNGAKAGNVLIAAEDWLMEAFNEAYSVLTPSQRKKSARK